MSDEILKNGITTFLSGLYKYKENEAYLIESSKSINSLIDFHQKNGLLPELTKRDITKLVSNKYNFLIHDILKHNFDLVFLRDNDDEELYPANFFVGVILTHFSSRINDIQASFSLLIDEIEKFDYRMDKVSKKRLRMLASLLKGNNLYDFDEESRLCAEKILAFHKTCLDKIDAFYREDIIGDYHKIVEEKLAKGFDNISHKDEFELVDTIVTIYELDIEFLRSVEEYDQIEKVRCAYLKYMEEHNLDTSRILDNNTTGLFIAPQKNLFDPTPYLHMSLSEISQEVFRREMENVQNFFSPTEFDKVRDILGDVGIILLDPITIDPSNLESDNPSDQIGKQRKRK